MKYQAAEATIASVAQKVSAGAGGVALFGGLTANEAAALGGVLIALLGLLVQVYYKRRDDQRRTELHRMRVAAQRFRPYEDDADV